MPRLAKEREDEIAAAGMDQEVRVLDALGDAFIGKEFADVVAGEEGREVFRRDIGVNRHESLQRLAFAASLPCVPPSRRQAPGTAVWRALTRAAALSGGAARQYDRLTERATRATRA
jgi:hypothetical protein